MGNFPPRTNQAGRVYTSKGDGSDAGVWADAGGGIFRRYTKTYDLIGPLAAYTLPLFRVAVAPGALLQLYGVVGSVSSGTVTAEVTLNGTGVPGLGSISLSPTSTGWVLPSGTFDLADLDEIAVVLSSPSGTGDLSFDIALDSSP
jgi:hypothetical protein